MCIVLHPSTERVEAIHSFPRRHTKRLSTSISHRKESQPPLRQPRRVFIMSTGVRQLRRFPRSTLWYFANALIVRGTEIAALDCSVWDWAPHSAVVQSTWFSPLTTRMCSSPGRIIDTGYLAELCLFPYPEERTCFITSTHQRSQSRSCLSCRQCGFQCYVLYGMPFCIFGVLT